MEAKARAAALEIKAAFLKERQALRMASEELELRQEIVQAKIEEKVYEQFEMEQNIDGMNDYLETMKAKYTSTPISSQAIPCDQVTLSVASLSNVTSGKPHVPAIVNSVNAVSMTTTSTTPTSAGAVFKTSTMNAAAQPFVPVDRLQK